MALAPTSDHKLLAELVLHKIWGAAACPPQAFSIRPLPGFSLGAVSRLLRQSRLSQSVCPCPKVSGLSFHDPSAFRRPFLSLLLSGSRGASSGCQNVKVIATIAFFSVLLSSAKLSFIEAKLGFRP